jgi:flagellar biosynthetic protein FlhB
MRQKAMQVSRQRILAAVADADVVITNPTHVAVALRYGERDLAPTVIAKGHDQLALRIRTEARANGIPILENRALARALDAQVPVGGHIQVDHYVAVAEVLAFVFRLHGGKRRRRKARKAATAG